MAQGGKMTRLDEIVTDYIETLAIEKESLIAKYLLETGYLAKDICIVERATDNGRVFYPDLKSKYFEETK
jgi:hypothetical protein